MMTRTASTLVLLVCLALALPLLRASAGMPFPSLDGESNTTSPKIMFNPQNSEVAVGKTFSVDITVAYVANLTAWETYIYFLNGVLNCTKVTEGPFLKAVAGTIFGKTIINNYNGTHGRVQAYSSIMRSGSAQGSGVLATVTFQVLNSGDTQLHLTDTRLYDEKMPPQLIVCSAIDGKVIASVPDVLLPFAVSASGAAVATALVVVYSRRKKGEPETPPAA